MNIVLVILFLISISAFLSIFWYSCRYGISPMPTTTKVAKELLSLIPKSIHGNIYELGSGWGGLAFRLAKEHTYCQISGYEISIVPWLYSWIKQKILYKKYSNLKFLRKNFLNVSLSDAKVIVCYLYPTAMNKLKIKCDKEHFTNHEVFLLTHTFALPGVQAIKNKELNDLYHTKIYLYKIQ